MEPTPCSFFVKTIIPLFLGAGITYFAGECQRKKEKKQKLKNFRKAIKTEVELLLETYKHEMIQFNSCMEKGVPFEAHASTNQNYFVLYDANANMIGMVDDDNVRTAIVRVYMMGKRMMDSMNLLHFYSEKNFEIDTLNGVSEKVKESLHNTYRKSIDKQSNEIQKMHPVLIEEAENLIKKL